MQYAPFKPHEENRHQVSFPASPKVLAAVLLALSISLVHKMNTTGLGITNSAFKSCCGCRDNSSILKTASDPDEYPFSVLKHSTVALDIFFVDEFTSKCKLRQEDPEIATECFVFSAIL